MEERRPRVEVEMTVLDDAISPATAVEKLQAAGIHISERTLRERARAIGACRIIGKAMFLLPSDIDTIITAAKPEPAKCHTSSQEKAETYGGMISPLTESGFENLLKRASEGSRKTSRTTTKRDSVVPLSMAKRRS
jgi:hypothetical protein